MSWINKINGTSKKLCVYYVQNFPKDMTQRGFSYSEAFKYRGAPVLFGCPYKSSHELMFRVIVELFWSYKTQFCIPYNVQVVRLFGSIVLVKGFLS